MESTAKALHSLAEWSREAGHFVEALIHTDEALVEYQKEKNVAGMADILSSRSITLRHLYEQTADTSFLILAKHETMAAIEFGKASEDKTAASMPLFRHAQILEELKEYKAAHSVYEEAVVAFKNNPPENNDRPAVLLDLQIRTALCAVRAGESARLDEALELIEKLNETDEYQYNKDVWVSGGYMNVAQILKDTDAARAREYLEKAKKVIDGNEKLTLRKAQWEKLAASFEK